MSASGSSTLNGNEIILDGGGQRVYLELKLSGWGPWGNLSTWQAVLDPATLGGFCVGGGNDGNPCFKHAHCYGGGVCTPARPGPIVGAVETCTNYCDSGDNIGQVCLGPTGCPNGDYDPCTGGNEECGAAFSNAGASCNAGAFVCNAGWQDFENRSDYVIQGGVPGVDNSTPRIRFGSQTFAAPPPRWMAG